MFTDLVARARGDTDDTLVPDRPFARMGQLGALFMLAAIALAGLPPLSGFIGKLLILDALADHPQMAWAWVAVLGGSLITIVGFARAGSLLFWKSTATDVKPAEAHDALPADITPSGPAVLFPTFAALGVLAALTILAGPVSRYLQATADELHDPAAYIEQVLINQGETKDLSDHGDADYGDGEGYGDGDHAEDDHGDAATEGGTD